MSVYQPPSAAATPPPDRGLLSRLGLHRPELRAWAMYDWANSAFVLVVITAVFPIYFSNMAQAAGQTADQATANLSWATTIALVLTALMSPTLGALSDFLATRKRFLAISVAIGSLATIGLGLVQASASWQLLLLLFAIGNLGLSLSFVFYDAFLPYIAREEELDRVSSGGYALGYLGSSVLLVVALAAIKFPASFGLADASQATRASFVAVGLWWAGFSIPLFRRIAEPPRLVEGDETNAKGALAVTFRRLFETFRSLRTSYKPTFTMLIAFMIYNDGIGTIIRMAGIYAASRGLPEQAVIFAILLVQVVGIPFAFLFGNLGGRIGTKNAILIGVAAYGVISFVAWRMDDMKDFYLLALLVAMVQGGTQALSRSLFASMVPKHKSSEFFGFFSVFEKVAGILGPLLFGLMIAWTGSSQTAILSIVIFFVVGGFLLTRVDVEAGQRQAREEDAHLAAAG
jgi:UMF1 family MFS transporter